MEHSPKNALDKAKSPYLRQHKDNPVNWQVWGPAAFAKARAENKPVLLSVGYAACHWCHVMAHESFENPAVARLMNAHFVCIKLDREERPDLDTLYQRALALMGKQGGWPLTMFLDGHGRPFWGGTYFPPLPRHGLPAFADVLQGVAQSYANEVDNINHNVAAITAALQESLTPPSAAPVTPEIVARAAAHIRADIDTANGGLGSAPKFPQVTRLRLLWDHALRAGDRDAGDAVVDALVAMCRGGLYDHIGGGFFRYCVDAAWQTPHFEKMLDDQAMLVQLLADVVSHRPHPLLEDALASTIAFVLRDMADTDSGLFISSLDADSAGGEGGHYLWQADEINALLGDHAALFFRAYRLHDGHVQRLSLLDPDDEDALRLCRKKLLYARRERPAPARDNKILCDANARMIAALATAGWRRQRPDWHDVATTLFDRLDVSGPSLPRHVLGDDDAVALADDATALALCAITLAQAAWHKDPAQLYMARTRALMAAASAAFMQDDGRWTSRAKHEDDAFMPIPPLADAPAPAAAATALRVLTLLAATEDADAAFWHERATRLATALAAPARDQFTMMAAALSALQFYQNPLVLHAGADWYGFSADYLPDALWLQADRNALTVCLGTACLDACTDKKDAQALIARALRACLHKAANG